MADLFPVAGALISIGDVTATKSTDFVASDFSGVTWVNIDGWETMGGYGDIAEIITSQLINRGRDVKQKGTRNAGSMVNQFVEVNQASGSPDAGQQDLIDAEKTSSNYAFRIVFDDVPSGGATGTTEYFIGLVMSWNRVGGGANVIRMREATIEINSNIVTVDAV